MHLAQMCAYKYKECICLKVARTTPRRAQAGKTDREQVDSLNRTLLACALDRVHEKVCNSAADLSEEVGHAGLGQVPLFGLAGNQVLYRQVPMERIHSSGNAVLLHTQGATITNAS